MGKRRVFLIHGWGGYPEEGWRPWLKKKLKEKEFTVVVPLMPDTEHPNIETWVLHLSEIVETPDKYCYFVGHSLACITILRYLETLKENQKVGGVILVAGFAHDLEYPDYQGEISGFFKNPIDWEKIKKHCRKFIVIHSDDDPYVPLEHADIFKEKLDAEVVIMRNMKHFSGDDGITELPIVLDSILKLVKEQSLTK